MKINEKQLRNIIKECMQNILDEEQKLSSSKSHNMNIMKEGFDISLPDGNDELYELFNEISKYNYSSDKILEYLVHVLGPQVMIKHLSSLLESLRHYSKL